MKENALLEYVFSQEQDLDLRYDILLSGYWGPVTISHSSKTWVSISKLSKNLGMY